MADGQEQDAATEAAGATISAAETNARAMRQDRRAIIRSEGIKGLFLSNGAGAIALLAFLQAVYNDKALVPWVLAALALLAVGVALAAILNLVWHKAALQWEKSFSSSDGVERSKARAEGLRLDSMVDRLAVLSIGCFALAVFSVIIGGLNGLSNKPSAPSFYTSPRVEPRSEGAPGDYPSPLQRR